MSYTDGWRFDSALGCSTHERKLMWAWNRIKNELGNYATLTACLMGVCISIRNSLIEFVLMTSFVLVVLLVMDLLAGKDSRKVPALQVGFLLVVIATFSLVADKSHAFGQSPPQSVFVLTLVLAVFWLFGLIRLLAFLMSPAKEQGRKSP